ncbi:MAG: alanine racemase [Gammaproteobacteria bacterium]|nr:alanine racemase [Gammaproteobacteria bacterium]
MPRPLRLQISQEALLHNLSHLKKQSPASKVLAIVKANAYGCGIEHIIPALEGQVDQFGVATLNEALAIRALGSTTPCVILQGVFEPEDWLTAAQNNFECILHQPQQLSWLLQTPLPHPIKIWLKINTGMNRLGWLPEDVPATLQQLLSCAWVDPNLVLMTHFANADEPSHPLNAAQHTLFFTHPAIPTQNYPVSIKNSAAIFQFKTLPSNIIRPGLSLYGVSPFATQTGVELGLKPVMRFSSAITQLFSVEPQASVGYGSIWQATRPSRIGIVAVGYADGYPRHIQPNTPVYIRGYEVPIVGRVSMDSLTIDVTDLPDVVIGDVVELWGEHLAIERIATAAGTIPYELMVRVNARN